MSFHHTYAMSLIAAAALVACSSMPTNNAMLDQARSDYRSAQDNPQTRDLAGGELKAAEDALTKANVALLHGDEPAQVNHLAYIAKQRVAIAQETARQKAAEQAVGDADKARSTVRLAARTAEADVATQKAEVASQQADASRQEADEAKARSLALESQLKDLNAKQTDRGMVITIGDVLFDTDMAALKSGAARNVDKLVAFMKEYPQRKVLIEGFTDSTGSDSHNLELSGRRADAVRAEMVGMGIGSERISTHGYGEARPVASNDTASGRQLNRRVEIVLSNEVGIISQR